MLDNWQFDKGLRDGTGMPLNMDWNEWVNEVWKLEFGLPLGLTTTTRHM
jgi:hypothetical protein